MENGSTRAVAVGQLWEHNSGETYRITWAGDVCCYGEPANGGERVKIGFRRLKDEFRFVGMADRPRPAAKSAGRTADRRPAPARPVAAAPTGRVPAQSAAPTPAAPPDPRPAATVFCDQCGQRTRLDRCEHCGFSPNDVSPNRAA